MQDDPFASRCIEYHQNYIHSRVLCETLRVPLGFIAMKTSIKITTLVLILSMSVPSLAQRPGQDGGRGGFGGRGGSDGGGGSTQGGFSGRGSSSGGGFSGRGSSGRGGFDPSSFLSRLDTNGNGVLDPDEQQGPAQFMIQRMQASDPSIQPGKPIPLKKITDGFQKMREGASGSKDAPQPSSRTDEASLIPELLVQGFGTESDPIPLMGFGPSAEMLSVAVTETDEREANELLRRYDRNRDGFLASDEISSRFAGNPMDFDRNKDGKLTASELAVRYARRREGREETEKRDSGRSDRGREKRAEAPDVFNGRKSYRATAGRRLPEGLPGYFTDKDTNGDRQVTMAEFSSDWSNEVVKEFFNSDLNRDGVITADEALRVVENPGIASAMASTSSTSKPASPATSVTPALSGPLDEKYVKVGQRIIERYDKNGDKALTASEWDKMLMSPADADGNRDGRITVEEYASWMMSREKK